jgi:hypothetical protein
MQTEGTEDGSGCRRYAVGDLQVVVSFTSAMAPPYTCVVEIE